MSTDGCKVESIPYHVQVTGIPHADGRNGFHILLNCYRALLQKKYGHQRAQVQPKSSIRYLLSVSKMSQRGEKHKYYSQVVSMH